MPAASGKAPESTTGTTEPPGPLHSLARGRAARELWQGRLPTIRQPIQFWRDVAALEKNVWAEAWLVDVLKALDRFENRIEREIDFPEIHNPQ